MTKEQKTENSKLKVEEWVDVVLYGIGAGYLFRYGFILHSGTGDFQSWGVPASIIGFILGLVVFNKKPFWRSVVFVALGIGCADIATYGI